MSVTLQFRYHAQDVPEGLKVATRHIRRQRLRSGSNFKRLATWLLFVTIATIFVYFINHRRPQNAAPATQLPVPPTSNELYSDLVAPMIPWTILFVCVISFFVARHRRSLRKPLLLDDLYVLTANDDGLTWTEAAKNVEYRWHAFHGYAETANLFVLYQDDARSAQQVRILVVPKRAFPSSVMLLEFTELLKTHAREHTGAFPVIPIKPL